METLRTMITGSADALVRTLYEAGSKSSLSEQRRLVKDDPTSFFVHTLD